MLSKESPSKEPHAFPKNNISGALKTSNLQNYQLQENNFAKKFAKWTNILPDNTKKSC